MANSLSILRRKIKNTEELRTVVKTMKATSAATIIQFEQAVSALREYYRSVELALSVCLRHAPPSDNVELPHRPLSGHKIGVIAVGSNQGMVGQFNENLAQSVVGFLAGKTYPLEIWGVGERVQARLENEGIPVTNFYPAPQSIDAVAQLVSTLLVELGDCYTSGGVTELVVFHNQPNTRSNYETVQKKILPLDKNWRRTFSAVEWPGRAKPEILGTSVSSLDALIGEYLFVSLYQLFAESGAAENAARLAAMQRAEKNIEDRLGDLSMDYNRSRQGIIDEELFDLISGFETLSKRTE